ncbi:uncharacterized protein LOC142226611 [Haematobia irritans]|uniref:uncharacterized protein LOC142226611 n=1 Tax=Haematobia irritans TaxID=7368 RepID=UPI003F4F88DC
MDLIVTFISDLVHQVFDFSCILTWICLRVTSLSILTCNFFFNLWFSLSNGLECAFDYLEGCDQNLFVCTLNSGWIFIKSLKDFYFDITYSMTMWQILAVCLWLGIITFSPTIRKIMLNCIAFLLVGSFAALTKLVRRKMQNKKVQAKKWSLIGVFTFLVTASVKGIYRICFRRKSKKTIDPNLTCVVCIDRQKSVLLMPCKHVCLCEECASGLFNSRKIGICPLCRVVITNTMSIYM